MSNEQDRKDRKLAEYLAALTAGLSDEQFQAVIQRARLRLLMIRHAERFEPTE